MSETSPVEHDERTVAVGNASYRWAYTFVSFALLVDVICRGIFRQEAAWDLLALVVAGGAVGAFHQVREKTWTHRWTRDAALVALFAAIIGAVVAAVIMFWFGDRLSG